jgi:hypothetical protein
MKDEAMTFEPIRRVRIESDRCPDCGVYNGTGRFCRSCQNERDGLDWHGSRQ